MKIAIVHDWLTGMRGGERCLEHFLHLYPRADIFTLVHLPGSTSKLIDDHVHKVSILNKFPGIGRYYRALLPLFPLAIRSFNFEGYDLIISLSHAAAKNIRKPKNAKHVCYCFTPMRYIWDQSRFYFGSLTPFLWPLIKVLRIWDRNGARGVDHFVAISRFVSARIRLFYRRSAHVIFPPVETAWIDNSKEESASKELSVPGFLYAGALVPYKRPEIVIEAFRELKDTLWVVGGGPLEASLRHNAPSNVKFFGRVSDNFLAECYRKCRALIFPGIEDFGMIPVECMSAGKPVIALAQGGAYETVKGINPEHIDSYDSTLAPQKSTGVFIRRGAYGQAQGIVEAVRYFQKVEQNFNPAVIKQHASQFSVERFCYDWNNFAKEVAIPQGLSPGSLSDGKLISVGE